MVDKLKADANKRKKEKANAKEKATKVTQLAKEQKELANSALAAKKKEEERKHVVESKAAKAK